MARGRAVCQPAFYSYPKSTANATKLDWSD
jgi:hypothetical protein